MAVKIKNRTWQNNQAKIQDAYIKLIKTLNRCPTVAEICQEVKLSDTTIEKHIKELKFEPLKNPLRVLTQDVLMSIYRSARKGSYGSQRLWMMILEGWTEKIEVKQDVIIVTVGNQKAPK